LVRSAGLFTSQGQGTQLQQAALSESTPVLELGMNSLHNKQDQPSRGHDSVSSELGKRTIVTTQQARQGVTGHNVRYMLAFGLAAVVVAFAAIWLAYFA
jgi:hypothetical protein